MQPAVDPNSNVGSHLTSNPVNYDPLFQKSRGIAFVYTPEIIIKHFLPFQLARCFDSAQPWRAPRLPKQSNAFYLGLPPIPYTLVYQQVDPTVLFERD